MHTIMPSVLGLRGPCDHVNYWQETVADGLPRKLINQSALSVT
jgi:hypothetical protein